MCPPHGSSHSLAGVPDFVFAAVSLDRSLCRNRKPETRCSRSSLPPPETPARRGDRKSTHHDENHPAAKYVCGRLVAPYGSGQHGVREDARRKLTSGGSGNFGIGPNDTFGFHSVQRPELSLQRARRVRHAVVIATRYSRSSRHLDRRSRRTGNFCFLNRTRFTNRTRGNNPAWPVADTTSGESGAGPSRIKPVNAGANLSATHCCSNAGRVGSGPSSKTCPGGRRVAQWYSVRS